MNINLSLILTDIFYSRLRYIQVIISPIFTIKIYFICIYCVAFRPFGYGLIQLG